MTNTTATEKRIIKLSEVMRICNLSRTSVYKFVREGTFPMFIKVGRATYWEYNEVQNWINEKLEKRTSK